MRRSRDRAPRGARRTETHIRVAFFKFGVGTRAQHRSAATKSMYCCMASWAGVPLILLHASYLARATKSNPPGRSPVASSVRRWSIRLKGSNGHVAVALQVQRPAVPSPAQVGPIRRGIKVTQKVSGTVVPDGPFFAFVVETTVRFLAVTVFARSSAGRSEYFPSSQFFNNCA